MKRLLILTAAVLAITTAAQAKKHDKTTRREQDRYVVILSLDAFRWDLASKAHTPTLDSLRRAGSYAETYPCFPSNTFPNHYAMATGLHPNHHGLVNNGFKDKLLGKTYSMGNQDAVADPDFYYGEPIWNTVEHQGKLANIFMWVGSETVINGRQASVWTPYSAAVPFTQRADWVIEALHRPVEEIPNLIMWYIEEPDAIMHRTGPDSPETKAMVEKLDSVLAYFFSKVKSSPVYEKIDFIITADHGMTETSPERVVDLWPHLDRSRVRDIAYGNPIGFDVEEEYLDEAYEALSKLEHITVFKRDEMPAKYHYGSYKARINNLLVLPDVRWKISYRDPAETPRPAPKPADHVRPQADPNHVQVGGSHGYDPFEKDMSMIFYGSGPHFKKGHTQKSFQNLNIYIILCHLLDIEPAPNDCDWRAVKKMFVKDKR